MKGNDGKREEFIVDSQFCIRCSSCSSLAPNNFRVGSEGSQVIKQPENESELNACLAAVTSCPANVISQCEVILSA